MKNFYELRYESFEGDSIELFGKDVVKIPSNINCVINFFLVQADLFSVENKITRFGIT